jgi:hypothetical protein
LGDPTGRPATPTGKTSVKEAVCWIWTRRVPSVALFTFPAEAQLSRTEHISRLSR